MRITAKSCIAHNLEYSSPPQPNTNSEHSPQSDSKWSLDAFKWICCKVSTHCFWLFASLLVSLVTLNRNTLISFLSSLFSVERSWQVLHSPWFSVENSAFNIFTCKNCHFKWLMYWPQSTYLVYCGNLKLLLFWLYMSLQWRGQKGIRMKHLWEF